MIQYPNYLKEQLAEANKKALSNCPNDRLTGFALVQDLIQGAHNAHGDIGAPLIHMTCAAGYFDADMFEDAIAELELALAEVANDYGKH